jgi:hypothetical protein
MAFMNIFDNVSDLFNFLKETPSSNLELAGDKLKIMVKVVRLREVLIDLTRTQISPQEAIERRLERLEKLERNQQNLNTASLQRDTQRLLEEFAKKNLKPLADEVKRLSERVLVLEEHSKQIDLKYRPANLFGPPPSMTSPFEGPRSNLFSAGAVSRAPTIRKAPTQTQQKKP